MSSHKVTLLALLAAAGLGVALACGPDFPTQVLDNRNAIVSPVSLSFPFEASRLVAKPADRLRVVEPDPSQSSQAPLEPEAVTTEHAEARSGAWRTLAAAGVSLDDLDSKLLAARAAKNGEAALTAGAGLPTAVATYIAGALEFQAGRYEPALHYFEAIDRLPPAEREIRAVAASYMQGRAWEQLGNMERARSAFQATRRAAEAGAPDPMGLAVASLGEEARTFLAEAGIADVPWAPDAKDVDDAKAGRLIASAVRLYAEQAARGSQMGLLSLKQVAAYLMDNKDALQEAVTDPLVRRLLVAYVLARSDDYFWRDEQTSEGVTRIVEAIAFLPVPPPGDDLDRLAAVLYLDGRYDVAEKLVADATRPLSLWIRAKLDLRRGDREAAIRDWTAAFRQMIDQPATMMADKTTKTNLRTDLAVVRMSQGDYGDAVRLLFPVAGDFWGDVAYITERVLTVDELKAFVDSLPLPPPQKAKSPDSYGFGFSDPDFVPGNRLRLLLARRLVREGRVAEAIAYFPPGQSNDSDASADEARGYQAALDASQPGRPFDWPWQIVPRAEALFKVAMLDRKRGMQLMGTEGPPDEAALDGQFDFGIGLARPSGELESTDLLGPDEERRFAASAPKPNVRFHYRPIATDRALAAADLLPQRSQAYAATLCWAARFAINSRDQAKAESIYKRYVSTGAYQAWAKNFGQDCPQPDFDSAKTFWLDRIEAWSSQKVRSAWRHKILLAMIVVAAVFSAGFLWRRRSLRGGSAT
jgi:tetratricopeptide (TPR) repeat protein